MKKIPLDNQTFEHPWDEKIIENVGYVIVGGTPSTSIDKYWGNDIPWMSSGDIHLKCIKDVPSRISVLGLNSSNATLVNPPSVAIGLAGQGKTRGTVALVLTTLCTNQSVALIKCEKNNLDIEYLFYNLESRYEELRSRSAGGGRAGLSKGILEKLTIPLPCIQEQAQIANVLSTIDLAITQTEAIIAKQQRIKTGLMQDLLTKGIDENGNIRSEATHEFKDSSIGRIPVEWDVRKIAELSEIRNGTTPSREKPIFWHEGTIPWLTTGQVHDRFIIQSNEFISVHALRLCSLTILPIGTILIAMIGQGLTRGKTAYLGFEATINQNFAAIIPSLTSCTST
jgi:type I restriction enzyme, S subunit